MSLAIRQESTRSGLSIEVVNQQHMRFEFCKEARHERGEYVIGRAAEASDCCATAPKVARGGPIADRSCPGKTAGADLFRLSRSSAI